MFLLAVASVLCLGQLAAGADLAQVCQNDDQSPVLLRNVIEVRQLIEELKLNPEACAERYHDSFLQLEQLVSDEILGNACSEKTSDDVEAYHSQFIHYFSPRKDAAKLKQSKNLPKDQRTRPIPRALYLFFIGYIKHLNAVCRAELPSKLLSIVDVQQLVSAEDLARFEKFTTADNLPLKSVRAKLNKWIAGSSLDSLLLSNSDIKFQLALPDKTGLPQIIAVCRHKLLPVLDEILRPILRLNELGYSGKRFVSQDISNAFKSKSMKRWLSAYQICESTRNTDLLIIPKEVCKASKKQGDQVRCKYGFVPAQKVAAFRKMSIEEAVGEMETIGEIEQTATKFNGELRYIRSIDEAEQAAQALRGALNAAVLTRTSAIVTKELQLANKMMRLGGLEPIPKGGWNDSDRKGKLIMYSIIVGLVYFIIMLLFAIFL